ncbi:hypothetical protein D3C72_1108150 [compost metagenome]
MPDHCLAQYQRAQVAEQQQGQREFLGRQRHRHAAHPGLALGRDEAVHAGDELLGHVAEARRRHGASQHPRHRRAPRQRLHARQQLGPAPRLAHVGIGAGRQAGRHLCLVVAPAQHHHRHALPERVAHPFQHVARGRRGGDGTGAVQQQHVVAGIPHRVRHRLSTPEAAHDMPAPVQRVPEHPGAGRVVRQRGDLHDGPPSACLDAAMVGRAPAGTK